MEGLKTLMSMAKAGAALARKVEGDLPEGRTRDVAEQAALSFLVILNEVEAELNELAKWGEAL